MRTMLLLCAVVAASLAACDTGINNGAMDGAPVDHSDGKGLLVTPAGWTPVNVDTGRGDRLSVEASDRPGAGQCLHVKTFGSDAGVYQTITPLDKGKSYLVSAWVKRLSGTLAVEAYPYAWGPAVMRRVDGSSSGWTRLSVGLTPIDGGAHLYLVAFPQAEFLIDDVQISPALLQVSAPQPLPYDYGSRWRYRVNVTPLPGAQGLPKEIIVEAVSDNAPGLTLSQPLRLTLPASGATTVEVQVPVRAEGGFSIRLTDAATGDLVGASPTEVLTGDPWVFHWPHKHALYSSLGYQWPLRVSVLHADPASVQALKARATILDARGKTVREMLGGWSHDSLLIALDGRRLPPAGYRLRLTVSNAAGR